MDTNATETKEQPIAADVVLEDDKEARIAQLEAEKSKIAEEKENYRKAYLKASDKNGDPDTDDDDRIRRITQETLANSRLADIAREQDEIIKKALKENKELKLAQMNKTNAPITGTSAHSEGAAVQDTLVTSDQLAAFKARGWDDKKIEAYKKNLLMRK